MLTAFLPAPREPAEHSLRSDWPLQSSITHHSSTYWVVNTKNAFIAEYGLVEAVGLVNLRCIFTVSASDQPSI